MPPNQVEIVEVCRRQLHALSLCGGSEIEAMAVRDATVAPPAPDRVIRDPSIPRQLFDEGLHTPILANLASKSRGIRVAISRMAVSPELGDKLAMAARPRKGIPGTTEMQLGFARRVLIARIAACSRGCDVYRSPPDVRPGAAPHSERLPVC